jgi:hypothetical protein
MTPGRIISIIGLVFVLAIVAVGGYLLANPTSTAQVKITVKQAPADDASLKQWLSTQSEISNPIVTRSGNGTDSVVVVEYTTPNYHAGDYSIKLIEQCKQLGYALVSYSCISNGNPFREYGAEWRK